MEAFVYGYKHPSPSESSTVYIVALSEDIAVEKYVETFGKYPINRPITIEPMSEWMAVNYE